MKGTGYSLPCASHMSLHSHACASGGHLSGAVPAAFIPALADIFNAACHDESEFEFALTLFFHSPCFFVLFMALPVSLSLSLYLFLSACLSLKTFSLHEYPYCVTNLFSFKTAYLLEYIICCCLCFLFSFNCKKITQICFSIYFGGKTVPACSALPCCPWPRPSAPALLSCYSPPCLRPLTQATPADRDTPTKADEGGMRNIGRSFLSNVVSNPSPNSVTSQSAHSVCVLH